MTHRIQASFVPRARHLGDVTPWEGTVDDLELLLRQHGAVVDDKDGPAVVVSAFNVGDGLTRATQGKRGRFRQEHLVASTWLVGLDFDERPGDAREILAPLRGLDVIAYTSHSHGRVDHLRAKARKELSATMTGEALDREVERRATAPRVRALLPLARSVTPAELRVLHRWLDAYCGGGSDTSVGEPCRLFYTPRRRADDAVHEAWVERWRGQVLDPDRLPDGRTVAELLLADERAAAPVARGPIAAPEAERRRAAAAALPPLARNKAERRAQDACRAAIARIPEATPGGRRKRLFAAACRIGEHAALLHADGVRSFRSALLDAAALHVPDAHDHERQVDNGIARGRLNPADVAELLHGARRSLPIVDDGAAPMPLDVARERVREVIGEAVRTPGRWAVAADPGAGKTEAVVDEVAELWRAGLAVRVCVPTNKLADEVRVRILRATLPQLSDREAEAFAEQVGVEPKRTAENCQNLDAVLAGKRAGGVIGARAVCQSCDLHPNRQAEGSPRCAYFREVIDAQAYRVTVTTHALEVLRATASTTTHVDDFAFRRAKLDGRYRGAARWEADGLVLTLVPDENGAPPPELRWRGMGTPRPHRADDLRLDEQAVLDWLAEADGRPCAPTLDDLRHKYEPEATGGVDLVVVDERPKAADEAVDVTERDLAAWRWADDLDLDDDHLDALRRVFAKAVDTPVAAGGLAEVLPPGSVRVRRLPDGRPVNATGGAAVKEHAAGAGAGDAQAREALASSPDVAALEALEAACSRRWQGCFIDRRGTLHLTTPRPVAAVSARSVLYLDGTATEATARALLGPSVRFHRLAVELHPETRIVRVDWSAAKGALRKSDDAARRRGPLRHLRALVRRYGSPTTAWVLHKAWVDDPEVRELLADALDAGHVTYFGAADVVGSNRLKDCTRIVLCDWHVPRAAKQAAAEVLAIRAEADDGLAGVDWTEHAAHALEGAEIVQAAYRVRPAEHAREVVLVTERDTPAAWRAVVQDSDELLADELGLLPAGPAGAVALLRRTVDQRGPVALRCGCKGSPDLAQRALGRPRGPFATAPLHALSVALRTYEGRGGVPAAAAAAGLACAYVRTSTGGAYPVVFVPGATPSARAVVGLLAEVGVSPAWVDWQGVRLDVVDDGAEALDALRRIGRPDAVSWEALAELLGVSPATARRRLTSCGVSSLAELRARWAVLTRPDDLVLDTVDGPIVAVVGGAAWLALADPADVARWALVSSTPCECPLRTSETGPPLRRW